MTDQVIPPDIGRLLELLDSQESLVIEFKSAQGGLPRSIWPTISAFANTSGGRIVLGVAEESTGKLRVDGIANPSMLIDQFHNVMRDSRRISVPICGPTDISVERVGGKNVVVVHVPQARRAMRPVYINGNPHAGTYVRRNTGDYACTPAEVSRMMREASDLSADSVVLEYLRWNDLDESAFRRYRTRFQGREPGSPLVGFGDSDFMQAIGGFRRDRERDVSGYTVAGLLMFGQPDVIREWRGRHLIDFRIINTTNRDPIAGWFDRVIWEGNLFGAYEAVYPKLTAGLPAPLGFRGSIKTMEPGLRQTPE